jgi:pimeloyl-ACP methyl ester carboxylesterase
VVLLHGFPELWYSWRHQIPALAGGGLRVIAPDLRGYGRSDKPQDIEEYDIHHLVADQVGLLDVLGLEKAVFVGHDWGGIIVWMVAVMHPGRVERVVSLNVPYRGGPGFPPTEILRQMDDRRFSYVLFFQEPGRAETYFEADLPGRLKSTYQTIAANPDFLTQGELQVYVDAFREGGMTGPLNFYRNVDRNCETTQHLAGRSIDCHSLIVMAEKDPILRPKTADGMERLVPNLRRELIRDCGHWTQQEKPQEVNRLLLDFLGDLAGA